jgi:hypothetical protein
MTHSVEIDSIVEALGMVQSRLRPVKRNVDAGEFDYADLGAVVKAIRGQLAGAGLVAIQSPSGAMVGAVFMASVTTTIYHCATEQWISELSSCPCPPSPRDYGAAITMLRRYALATMTGLVQAEQIEHVSDGLSQAQRLVKARQDAAKEPIL